MNEFFSEQADYFFFIYGLTFVILGTVCFIDRRSDSSTPSLNFLGLFGFTYGLYEWLTMLMLSSAGIYWLSLLSLVFKSLSFMFLLEFCRVGIAKFKGIPPVGRWIFLPPLVLMLSGALLGAQPGLDDAVRYGFGLISSLIAAITLFRWGRKIDGKGGKALVSASLAMAGFGVTLGIVLPDSSWLAGQLVNETTFLTFTHIPVQFLHGVFAGWMVGSILRYEIYKLAYPMPRKSAGLMNLGFAVLGVILFSGAMLTNYFDTLHQQDMREHINAKVTILTERLANEINDLQLAAVIMTGFIHDIADTENIIPALDHFAAIEKGVVACVTDMNGNLIATSRNTPALLTKEYAAYKPFADTVNSRTKLAQFEFSDITHKPVFYIHIPIADEFHRRIGYVFIRKNIDIIPHDLNGLYSSFIIDDTGKILSAYGLTTNHKLLWDQHKTQRSALFQRPLLNGEKITLDSQTYAVGRKLINDKGWSVVVMRQETLSGINRIFAITMTLLICILILILLVILQRNILTEIQLRRDHEKLRKLSEALEKQSITDTLTGAYNRLKFDVELQLQMKAALRYKTPLALIMYDIDHFKQVNDTYGHQIGDYVLKELTTLVARNIRSSDMLARWGGEEFMIVVPQDHNARALAEKLRYAIAHHDFDKVSQITCSFGVAYLLPNDTPETFTGRADDALYEAKLKGRNRVEV